ncbi:MAG: general stress protein CsbD, partial [Planctomycetes bacterium]|nr:general stress protein CsbD [Planctomycetota bacterium]
DQAEGDTENLIGLIQRKTGEARENIEDALEDMMAGGSGAVSRATEAARHYAENVAAAARTRYEQAVSGVRGGYQDAEGLVRRHPTESVAAAFGAGLITGVVVGLMLRSR